MLADVKTPKANVIPLKGNSMSSDAKKSREVQAVENLIDTYVRYKDHITKGDRKYEYYHPSEWGACLREQQYRHYAWANRIEFEYSDLSSKMIRLFDKGHNMHIRWKDYFNDMGNILMGRWKCTNDLCYLFDDHGVMGSSPDAIKKLYQERRSRIHDGNNGEPIFRPEKCICGNTNFEYMETRVVSEELKMKGNADLIINCDNLDIEKFKKEVENTCDVRFLPTEGRKVVIDMKTMGSNQWKINMESVDGRTPLGALKKHILQVSVYVNILGCDYGIILYENKDNSKMSLYKVERDPKIWEVIQFQAKSMVQQREKGLLPPPKPSNKNDSSCKQCEFRTLCHKSQIWNDPNVNQWRNEFYKCLL